MPISEDAFRKPTFTKYKERYPLSYDKNQRYTDTIVNPMVNQIRANSSDGSGWRQPGYNPNHNSTRTETVTLTTESPQFKPY